MKNYLKSFFFEEDGIETIEFLALVAIAVALLAVITTVASKLLSPAKDLGAQADSVASNIETLKGLGG